MVRRPAARCPGLTPGPGHGQDLLTVSMSVRAGYTVVGLSGEGDVTVRDRLRAALAVAVRAGARDLVVDLSGLRFIDASCVRVLCRASWTIGQDGGRVELAAPRPMVARVLELMDVTQVMGVHDSIAKAVNAVGR